MLIGGSMRRRDVAALKPEEIMVSFFLLLFYFSNENLDGWSFHGRCKFLSNIQDLSEE